MASRFPRGSTVYDKNGRSYVVEEVDGGMVYCSAENGVEAEFPESVLVTEAEFGKRSNAQRDVSYGRIRQSRHYMAPSVKLDAAACQKLLGKLEGLSPGITDFAAYTVASRALSDNKEGDQVASLSVVKSREVWNAAPVEARASLMAGILATAPTVLVGMANVGDFLLRAMIEKGLATHGDAYAAFLKRPRR